MSRCKKNRCCRSLPGEIIYKPVGVPMCDLTETDIALDEFEAMRLCDLEGLEQIAAASRMAVSRGTVQRLLNSGRRKLMEAFLAKSAIRIKNAPMGGEEYSTNEVMHSDYR